MFLTAFTMMKNILFYFISIGLGLSVCLRGFSAFAYN